MPTEIVAETAPLDTSRTPAGATTTPTCIDEMPYIGVWKHEPKPHAPDEMTKVPYNPRTGRRAKPNDARTFGTRPDADAAFASGGYDGLCVLIDEALGITAGDLDHVVPANRAFDEAAIPPEVRRLIRVAGTYTSWSPSGTGIRFYFAAIVPGYKNRTPADAPIHAEQYHRVRFMTETLRRISGTPETFTTDRGDLEAWLILLEFERREETPAARAAVSTATPCARGAWIGTLM